ncbi:MAG: RecQ family ATP-dependent DNA helicase [Bacteroidales bacterium]|nr:RecQ family ATP-dependent DNA helicase [Bacteroidales bacterium]
MRAVLKEYWGFDSFRPLQEEIIQSVYAGKDTLGLMPTGEGKSLTFQVPTLMMEGICIVVTPLIALMKDQVDALRQKGIKATMVHSGMSHQEIIIALENCIFGKYKFLYVSPERIGTDLFLAKLQDMTVCMIAVDESHCISQWGYDFRPSYLQISRLRDLLPDVPVLALTATAIPEVVDDIQTKLCFREKNVFKKSFERKNIAYVIRKTEDKAFEMIKILKSVPGSGIVYVRSRRKTKEIAEELNRQGIQADYFHAGLTSDEKIEKQNKWKSDQCRIIVCTNAFGMGIDKPDVRVVVHYELPSSLEEYFQEAGRAGRDSKKAYAVALFSVKDQVQLKRRVKDEFPEKEFIKKVYEKLAYFFEIGMGMGINTGHNFIIEQFCAAYHFNIKHVHSALKLLDMSGYIEYQEDTDRHSKLIFTVQRETLYHIDGLKAKLEDLLQVLLRSYTGLFSDYRYIDERLLARRTGLSFHEVYEGLKSLSDQNIIHYIPAKKVPVIYYIRDREELRFLEIPKMVYEERKERLQERIEKVLYYGSTQEVCRSKVLLEYFGEKDVSDCGHCDICLHKKKGEITNELIVRIIEEIKLSLSERIMDFEELLSDLDYNDNHIVKALRFMSDSGQIKIIDNKISLQS